MHHHIDRWFGWIRAVFGPRSPGRHSRGYRALAAPVRPSGVRRPRPIAALWDGDRLAVVRPYVIANEQRQQEQRRRALLLATLGVDVGPRVIHGVEVPR
jgi:hypothetical protein